MNDNSNNNGNASEENLNEQKKNPENGFVQASAEQDERAGENSELMNDSSNTPEHSDGDDAPARFQEYFSEEVETSGPKITDKLLTFLELKNVDEELAEIEEEKGDLPETIDAIKSKIGVLQKELDEKKHSMSILHEESSKLGSDNSQHEEKIGKYDEQKFDVRSNKEYDEIVKTIEAMFEEVKKNEVRIKEVKELTSLLEADVNQLEEKVKDLTAELDEKQSLLDELNEQYKQEEVVLNDKRKELVSKLDPQSSSLYERINNNFKGEATAIVRKGNCSGCYNSIPPQRVIEIRAAEKIFTCQSCGRILISEELIAK